MLTYKALMERVDKEYAAANSQLQLMLDTGEIDYQDISFSLKLLRYTNTWIFLKNLEDNLDDEVMENIETLLKDKPNNLVIEVLSESSPLNADVCYCIDYFMTDFKENLQTFAYMKRYEYR